MNLLSKIKNIKYSVVAIGLLLPPDKVNIIGSGFSVDSDGTILSVAHLFKDISKTDEKNLVAFVIEKEEGNLNRYKWVHLDIISKDVEGDAAVLKIKSTDGIILKPLLFGDVDKVGEGQEVYFTGFPYAADLINEGFGVSRITNKGIISAVKYKSLASQPLDWFIVDAISNPGNSGCPLIDVETNKVIGIMSISFRIKSKTNKELDIREPMHIAGAKPITYAKDLFDKIDS